MLPKDTLSRPDLFSAKRVVCIQPHYDDNDIYAGGTIALLHDLGAEIIYLTVTDDLVGVLDQSLTDKQMTSQLRAEQKEAGEIIGVKEQFWLGYPDAGQYDYYQLRKDIIGYIRLLQPDFLMTVDPWLPYEAHRDHILTGQAASEAVLLLGFTRLKSKPEIDQSYVHHKLLGIAYYNSPWPNLVVDISRTTQRKHKAFCAYKAQLTSDDLAALEQETDSNEKKAADGQNFSHAEKIKLIRPNQLHGNTATWQS
jgi:N,N'-diacetylchitobiose non-reducing end deacetylase